MKVRKEQIINIFILVYVVLIMTSSNTGLLATKLIRLLLPFLIILFLIYRRYIKKDSFSFAIWGLLFLGYCLIRAPYATDTNYAYNYIASTFYVFIINACIYAYLTTSPHQIYPLIKSLIWGSVIANIYAEGQWDISDVQVDGIRIVSLPCLVKNTNGKLCFDKDAWDILRRCVDEFKY